MFHHLLVPTDGSPLSEATERQAVQFARTTGAKITFPHVRSTWPELRFGECGRISPMTPEKFDAIEQKAAERVLGYATQLCKEAGVVYDTLGVDGDDPAEAILLAAYRCGADLIFMASHGRKGIKSLLMGSETHKVLTHTKIPVLVYR